MNNWIIVGIPLLLKAIILGMLNILEVLQQNPRIRKRESIILHNNITLSSFFLYAGIKINYHVSTSIHSTCILSYKM